MPRCSETTSKNAARSEPKSATRSETEAPSIPIRQSKAGRWRALVLVLVHALIALHIAHWMRTGSTMTPLEPSEAMEFSKTSIVNAGAVFFALMIGSTLILGRWFCGWACHVVALQDACRWILVKLGIRPRMVNLGILGVVPWLAFTYMFLAPIVQRVLLGDSLAVRGTHYTTQTFWATFPSWPVALATFLCCGFAIVYFLGSKGFCTYGCPYGGIFGVVDQLAPVRIRVTDACEGCGHCTAVCTSNVRVHQEVRDFGMVVDPGCMKCLDCVSVCPKDALYVGWGAPAMFAKPREVTPVIAARQSSDELGTMPTASGVSRTLFMVAFIVATLTVFMSFDGAIDTRLLGWLTVGCALVAWIFRGKAKRTSEYSIGEELMLGGSFLAAMLTFRGLDGGVPFLFALGLSAILAYLFMQLVRLAYAPHVGIQNQKLRVKTAITKRGVVFASVMVPVLAFWAHAGWRQYKAGERVELARKHFGEGVEHYQRGDVDRAIASLELAAVGDPASVEIGRSLGGMLCDAGRFDEGIARFEIVLKRAPEDVATLILAALAYRETGDLATAQQRLESAVRIAPTRADAHFMLSEVCAQRGDRACAEEHRARASELEAHSGH